jgi:hypothetical protein
MPVTSPTYLLDNTYPYLDRKTGEELCQVHHMDLYRLEGEDDLTGLGLDHAFAKDVCIIEWPERLGSAAPADRLEVHILHDPRAWAATGDVADTQSDDLCADDLALGGGAREVRLVPVGPCDERPSWQSRLEDRLCGQPIADAKPWPVG